jgi:hypothetical protein
MKTSKEIIGCSDASPEASGFTIHVKNNTGTYLLCRRSQLSKNLVNTIPTQGFVAAEILISNMERIIKIVYNETDNPRNIR